MATSVPVFLELYNSIRQTDAVSVFGQNGHSRNSQHQKRHRLLSFYISYSVFLLSAAEHKILSERVKGSVKMASLRGIAKAIAIYTPLILIALTGELDSHELRPSYHGLDYQSSTADAGDESTPMMRSFFGGSSSPKSTSSNVAMPKAMNSNSTNNDTSWWGSGSSTNARGRDHVKEVLLVASVACGITGVALLVASTLICLFKSRRQRSPPVPPPTSAAAFSCDDTENKLQIVVRDS